MKYQFIVIYSDGPMGSTSLGGLIEKYGYLNFPFRKYFLSEYVMGIKKISDKSMQYKCIENLNGLSEKNILGGTSVKDRDSREGIVRTLKPKNIDIEKFLDFKPKSLESLISHCFLFYKKHIIYKKVNTPIRGFIIYEMPQFKINYNFTQADYIKALKKMDNFTFFIMNRNFWEWSASLISQQDYKVKVFFKTPKISLEKLFKRWNEIQILSEINYLHSINIESILLPNTIKTNKRITKILKLPSHDINFLKNQKYDLYGSLLSYNLAFKPSDNSFKNSGLLNKLIFKYFSKSPKFIRFIVDILFNLLRCLGLCRIK